MGGRGGDGLTVCRLGWRGEGERVRRGKGGGGGSAAGVCRNGVQATCHWGCSHDPTACCVGIQHEGAERGRGRTFHLDALN